MDKNEINTARLNIQMQIKTYAKKHYDARPMLDEYYRLTEEYRKLGGHPDIRCPVLMREYWENPLHWDRNNKNKNPIIGCENGRIIRKSDSMDPVPEKQEIEKDLPVTQTILDSQPDKSYYIINICWVETEDPNQSDAIEKISRFFEEMGIDETGSDKWENYQGQTEHSLTYMFEGTDDGYKMLKRSVITMLDIMSGCSFNIGVTGKKLNNM